jgi:hypothetical protein
MKKLCDDVATLKAGQVELKTGQVELKTGQVRLEEAAVVANLERARRAKSMTTASYAQVWTEVTKQQLRDDATNTLCVPSMARRKKYVSKVLRTKIREAFDAAVAVSEDTFLVTALPLLQQLLRESVSKADTVVQLADTHSRRYLGPHKLKPDLTLCLAGIPTDAITALVARGAVEAKSGDVNLSEADTLGQVYMYAIALLDSIALFDSVLVAAINPRQLCIMEVRRQSSSTGLPAVSVAGPFPWGGGDNMIEPDCAVDRLAAMFIAVNSQMNSLSAFVHSYPGYLLCDIIGSGASARVYSARRICEEPVDADTAGICNAHLRLILCFPGRAWRH